MSAAVRDDDGLGVVGIKSPQLDAMREWAASKVDGVKEIQRSVVEIYALALNQTVLIGFGIDSDGLTALKIKVQQEKVYRWSDLMREWKRKHCSNTHLVVGVFDGDKLAFDFTVPPNPAPVREPFADLGAVEPEAPEEDEREEEDELEEEEVDE